MLVSLGQRVVNMDERKQTHLFNVFPEDCECPKCTANPADLQSPGDTAIHVRRDLYTGLKYRQVQERF